MGMGAALCGCPPIMHTPPSLASCRLLLAHLRKVIPVVVHAPAFNSPVLRSVLLQVGYSLALAAHQFAGNSVSVFSALLVLQRWQADRFATYYNGGNIPLEALLPLYP